MACPPPLPRSRIVTPPVVRSSSVIPPLPIRVINSRTASINSGVPASLPESRSPLPPKRSMGFPPIQLADALNVGPVAGVHSNLVALANEQRHVDSQPRLEDGRLGSAGGGVALETGVCLRHPQRHRRWKLDVDRIIVVGEQIDHVVLTQIRRSFRDR